LLVFVHELGHFWLAKKNGVKVEEFAFGFRPRLWGKTIGETTYAVNLIPLGGYVKLFGEGGERGERSLKSKSIWQRFQILVAGSAMNFLLGTVVLTILFAVGFIPIFPGANENPFVESNQQVKVSAVNVGSPAEQGGLLADDVIVSFAGTAIKTDYQFVELINQFKGKEVELSYLRPSQIPVNALATPATIRVTLRTNPPPGQGPLGAAITTVGSVKSPLIKAPLAAVWESGKIIGLSAAAFGNFIKNLVVKQQVNDDVTGLIGIGALTGAARRLGIDYLAQLVAIISLGLGIINLMPILPLDGGHVAALGYEKIARRPLSDKQLGILATAGLFFVILLFMIITYKDIVRFDVFERIF